MKRRRTFITLLFLLVVYFAGAQTNEERTKQLFDWMMVGQGDSIYARMNETVRLQVTPEILGSAFKMLEQQFGKYQSHNECLASNLPDVVVYYIDICFENSFLRFLTAFDADGLANTIRFVPLPGTSSVASELLDTDKVEEKEIQITSGEYTLPGILTVPKETDNPPVVILVHGSGPNDRDESVGPNAPFRDLAWGLAAQGVATLRYDKRTFVYRDPAVAADYDTETVDDALAAIELLRKYPEIDAARIYVIGHSLGALLAPRIAQRSGETLAGIVLIAAPARSMEDLLLEQVAYLSSLTNATKESKEQMEVLRKQAENAKKIGTDAFDDSIGLPLDVPASYWVFANGYRPVETACSLSLPILVLQGERDYQVTMEDFSLWKQGLSGQANVLFKSYPKLNHLLQEGEGKSTPVEYQKENGVPAYVIDDLVDWIQKKEVGN